MSLSDLASLGSFVSGLAVLASLVYLNLQIRQSSRNQRATIHQERATLTQQWLWAISAHDMMETWMRGAGGDQTLDAIQVNRFVISVISTMQTAEEMYYQHEDGMISESRWSTQVRRMKFQARDRGFRAAWRVARNVFEADFALFVDSLVNISEGGDRSGELFAPAWKQALASM